MTTRTPAEVFRSVILTRATQLGYTVYVNHMQDTPDKAIVVVDERGLLDPRTLRDTQTAQDRVEVQVRAQSHVDAGNVLPTLWEDVLRHVSATATYGGIVQCITKANTMGCMGQEPQTRRWRFNQAFFMVIS